MGVWLRLAPQCAPNGGLMLN